MPLFDVSDSLRPTSLELGRSITPQQLPTNTTTHRHPIHRWFNFIAGFSPEFVYNSITPFHDHAARLLDPFAGCGTAPLVAAQHGLSSVGYEPHPIFSRIARAKVGALSTESFDSVKRIEQVLAIGLAKPCPTDCLSAEATIFLSKLFPPDILRALIGARDALERAGLTSNDLAFLILSKIVDKSSHSQTDGIYKAPTSKKLAASPVQACSEITGMILDDIGQSTHVVSPQYVIHSSSSEKMTEVANDSIDVIVTSPPYLNNFDYAEMTRMLLYFWGIASTWGEITDKVRSRLIVNTTTALKGHKDKQEKYKATICKDLHGELGELVKSLAALRTQRAGKKEYDFLVYPYFSQMTSVLRECFRCMIRGRSIHIMVADAALYGVHISTPQYLHTILNDIGFRNTRCDLVRRRGHRWVLDKREGSKTGLGEYYIYGEK